MVPPAYGTHSVVSALRPKVINMNVNIAPAGAALGAAALGYTIGSDVDIDGVSDQVL